MLILLINPDSRVNNLHFQQARFHIKPVTDDNVSLIRELDRIFGQIDKDLLQAKLITPNLTHRLLPIIYRRVLHCKLNIFLRRLLLKHILHLLHKHRQIERLLIRVEHLIIHLREVKVIIDITQAQDTLLSNLLNPDSC